MELITSKTNRWVKLAEQLKHRKFRDKFSKFIMAVSYTHLDVYKRQPTMYWMLWQPQ